MGTGVETGAAVCCAEFCVVCSGVGVFAGTEDGVGVFAGSSVGLALGALDGDGVGVGVWDGDGDGVESVCTLVGGAEIPAASS